MVIQIVGLLTALVIITGIIMALMVWKKKANITIFIKAGILIIIASILLMIFSFFLQIIFFVIFPIFALGILYLIVGRLNMNKWEKTE